MLGDLIGGLFMCVFLGTLVLTIGGVVREVRQRRESSARGEALFRSMFPDLQPLFQPRSLVRFVESLLARPRVDAVDVWRDPRGFGKAVAEAAIEPAGAGERVVLRDPSGAMLAEFLVERQAEGAV